MPTGFTILAALFLALPITTQPQTLPADWPDDKFEQLTQADAPTFVPGWTHDSVLRNEVLTRFGVTAGIVLLLMLTTVRFGFQEGFDADDRWERIFGQYMKLGSMPAKGMDKLSGVTTKASPALDGKTLEIPLPIRIEMPGKVGVRGVRIFLLSNGLVAALLVAASPILTNFILPLIVVSIWGTVLFFWWVILLQIRGKLIVADRSQIVVATLKARDSMSAARVEVVPTSKFSVVSWYYTGENEAERTLELNTTGFMAITIPLGSYSVDKANAIRQRIAASLKIPDRDEARQKSTSSTSSSH